MQRQQIRVSHCNIVMALFGSRIRVGSRISVQVRFAPAAPWVPQLRKHLEARNPQGRLPGLQRTPLRKHGRAPPRMDLETSDPQGLLPGVPRAPLQGPGLTTSNTRGQRLEKSSWKVASSRVLGGTGTNAQRGRGSHGKRSVEHAALRGGRPRSLRLPALKPPLHRPLLQRTTPRNSSTQQGKLQLAWGRPTSGVSLCGLRTGARKPRVHSKQSTWRL